MENLQRDEDFYDFVILNPFVIALIRTLQCVF